MPDTEILRALISPQEMGLMQFSLFTMVRFCKVAANTKFANTIAFLQESGHNILSTDCYITLFFVSV